MTIDPELSRQLITLLSDRDNPASVHKVSLTPELDTCKFEIPGLLISSVELLRRQIIQR